VIDSFDGEFRWLSNFSPHSVRLNITPNSHMIVPTVEHAFQASKTRITVERIAIAQATTPGRAKRAGRKVALRADWEDVKLAVMEELVQDKFDRHPDIRQKLIETGDVPLEEGNHWGDTFWGVCNGVGLNHLGRILMTVRRDLQHNCQPKEIA